MIYYKNKTEKQNELINAMRENVRDYVHTLVDMEDQAEIIIGFEKFLKGTLKAECELDTIELSDDEVAVSLGDSINLEFLGICAGAGIQKGLDDSFDWKEAERDFKREAKQKTKRNFKNQPWKHKRKGNH